MNEKILILDFGSQYTQLIARRVRELNIYCEIFPFNKIPLPDPAVKGIILSGSPFSVHDENHPEVDVKSLAAQAPVLGVCYGAQLIAQQFDGEVSRSNHREYGRAQLHHEGTPSSLTADMSECSQIWMSHADSVVKIPASATLLAKTDSIPVAAFGLNGNAAPNPIFGIQFHPEVAHSLEGSTLLYNFCVRISGCTQNWTTASFIDNTVAEIKKKVGNEKVILALSGGVDSTVAATLIHRAIGENLFCFFVDNGLLRKYEFENVLNSYLRMGLNIEGVDAKDLFLEALAGVEDPEKKRKIIGAKFIHVFDQEAKKIHDAKWLAQGTIYPDVIESVSVHGPSATIKSHHNVGGLPDEMNLKILEPLRFLFKDEVRKVGYALDIDKNILQRHPFPGPGLAIRIISDITPEKVRLLQDADDVFISALKTEDLYNKIWQAGAILLPVKSVGVMGDERTYENVIALRAVTSTDGMTADWYPFEHEFLARVSNSIIREVRGINRVVYDISSKPPATIEWE